MVLFVCFVVKFPARNLLALSGQSHCFLDISKYKKNHTQEDNGTREVLTLDLLTRLCPH